MEQQKLEKIKELEERLQKYYKLIEEYYTAIKLYISDCPHCDDNDKNAICTCKDSFKKLKKLTEPTFTELISYKIH